MSPAPRVAIAFLGGALLAAALTVAGLERPGVVLGAFRFTAWDPRMPIMFAVAIVVQARLRAWMRRGGLLPAAPIAPVAPVAPVAQAAPAAPAPRIDRKLVAGGLLFGIGWGLGGVCPGPGVVALVTMAPHVLLFATGFVAGIGAYELRRSPRGAEPRPRYSEPSPR